MFRIDILGVTYDDLELEDNESGAAWSATCENG